MQDEGGIRHRNYFHELYHFHDFLRRPSPFGRRCALRMERWYFPTRSQVSRLLSHSIYRSFNTYIGEYKPGQRVIKPGVIILSYPGDLVIDNRNLPLRPSFTKNMVFHGVP
jgi:hypothetical protein